MARIGPALLLVTAGAILAYAVTFTVPGVDINVVGEILFLVGLLWLAIQVGLEVAAIRASRPRPAAPPPSPRPERRPPERPYDPVVGPPEEERPTRVATRRDR